MIKPKENSPYNITVCYKTHLDISNPLYMSKILASSRKNKITAHSGRLDLKPSSLRLRTTVNGINVLEGQIQQGTLKISDYDIGFPVPTLLDNPRRAILYSLQQIAVLENATGPIDPNLIKIAAGAYPSHNDFLSQFGRVAADLQKALYGGGHAFYHSGSRDFGVLLGHTARIEEHYTRGNVVEKQIETIPLSGESKLTESKHAESIDVLIERLMKAA